MIAFRVVSLSKSRVWGTATQCVNASSGDNFRLRFRIKRTVKRIEPDSAFGTYVFYLGSTVLISRFECHRIRMRL